MKPDIVNIQTEFILPQDRRVLGHQGIPSSALINRRTEALLHEAREQFQQLARPTALIGELSHDQFAEVYQGEGLNRPDDPLARIYPRSEKLFLFVATVGPVVSSEIERLISEGDLAEGSLLDSVASEAADCLAELVQNDVARPILKGERSVTDGVMRYSPGYCGWHISGQKRLFEFLEPDRIGVTINERFLMQPLKSVSGLILIGEKSIFEFENSFAFCSDCRNPSCQERYEQMKTGTFE